MTLETENPAEGERYHLSWEEIFTRLKDCPSGKVWGIVRGGVIVAALLHTTDSDKHPLIASSPEEADIIVDDIWDTGSTGTYFLNTYPTKLFWTIIDRRKPEDIQLGWVVFPWEVGEKDAARELLLEENKRLHRELQDAYSKLEK
jgi:hypoxanthine phosphoribosyltransferase